METWIEISPPIYIFLLLFLENKLGIKTVTKTNRAGKTTAILYILSDSIKNREEENLCLDGDTKQVEKRNHCLPESITPPQQLPAAASDTMKQ